ncbi:hypothetical protein F5X99DRAFT_408361 [Biscogniauxia marginata]|nr:hypothetical protein F5X99DRAFT_408361 [Biscogniauxia marginata]
MAEERSTAEGTPELTEVDKAVVRYADCLYKFGKPLWTREMLEDIEVQVDENPQFYMIQRIDGSYVRKLNERHFRPDEWVPKVIFFSHRQIANPTEEEWPNHHRLCSYMIQKNHHTRSQLSVRELHEGFVVANSRWRESEYGKYFEEALRSFEIPSTVNKVVCFALGYRIASADFEFTSRHPAALSIKPYSPSIEEVLEEHGFEVLGVEGVRGFLEVDENTVVFAVNAGTCVREIIADLARPAIIISHSFDGSNLSWDVPDQWILEHTGYNIR